jgi:chemotaxis protein methyltransferase CheR
MYFAENKKYIIENRLIKRMRDLGVKSYRDYFYLVKYDMSHKEFNQLMNLITTNETSFFRNPPQLKAFAKEVLPLVRAEKEAAGKKQIRIWSAGCSTGEEPYTLAMILKEEIPELDSWNVEILANDISEQVLYSARKGIYSEMTLRSTDKYIVQKYFTREPEGYKISEDIKKLVKLSHGNLSDTHKLSMFRDIDIVFCRNVMIYFSDEVKKNIVRQFYNSLVQGGYLFIGHSESLHGISKAFKLSYFKNALVYKKEPATVRKSTPTGETTVAKTVRTQPVTAQPARTHQIAATSERVRRVTQRTSGTLEKLEKMKELLAAKR